MRRILIALTAMLLASCQSPDENGLLTIHVGTLVDVEGGITLKDQMITVRGERIVNVKAWDGSAAHANLIDWSNYTALPGLIDGHTHLIGNIQSNDPLAPIKATQEEDLAIGAANALKTLKAGFTSVIDVGSYRAFTDVALRNAINAGDLQGPRMKVAGAYITVSGGGGEVVGGKTDVVIPDEFRRGVADSPGKVRSRVRDLIAGGADFIKMIATGAVLTVGTEPGEAEFSEAEMRAAVEEAAKFGKVVTAHAHGADGIKMAIRAGMHSIQHGSLIDDEGLAMMKDKGVWLVADIYNGDYIDTIGAAEGWPAEMLRKNIETTNAQREGFAKAVKLGVKIAYGTDGGVYPHGDNAKQMAYMVRYGLTPMQAIQSATLWGAQSMDLQADIGSITAGKFADLIAIKGDVLADITRLEHIEAVIKGGVLIP